MASEYDKGTIVFFLSLLPLLPLLLGMPRSCPATAGTLEWSSDPLQLGSILRQPSSSAHTTPAFFQANLLKLILGLFAVCLSWPAPTWGQSWWRSSRAVRMSPGRSEPPGWWRRCPCLCCSAHQSSQQWFWPDEELVEIFYPRFCQYSIALHGAS